MENLKNIQKQEKQIPQLKQFTLKPLGNDSGFGQFNTSYFYDNFSNKELYIFDFGYTVFNNAKLFFDLNSYDNIYVAISHMHQDHVGSLAQFILYMYSKYNKKVCVISKCKNIKQFLQICGVSNDQYKLFDDFINKDITINIIPTTHVDNMDCYSFLIQIDRTKILYTADTNSLEPYKPYLDNLDELYVDTSSKKSNGHLWIEDTYKVLNRLNLEGCKVKLIHLDDKETLQKYVDEFEKIQ